MRFSILCLTLATFLGAPADGAHAQATPTEADASADTRAPAASRGVTVASPPISNPPHAFASAHGHPSHHHSFNDWTYRSPGLAVVLSLTPMPVDFGNLYADNLVWGVAYTGLELALSVPMIWLAGSHMGANHGYGDDNRRWSTTETGWMVGLATGYIAVKLVASVQAGYAARDFNARYGRLAAMAMIEPIRGGALLRYSSGF